MYTLNNFHFLNGITEINQLFDDILMIWPAPVYINCPPIVQLDFSRKKNVFFGNHHYKEDNDENIIYIEQERKKYIFLGESYIQYNSIAS